MFPFAQWLTWILPILGAILIALIGWLDKRISKYIAVIVGAIAGIFAISMIPDILALPSLGLPYLESNIPWVVLPGVAIYVGVLLDPLSVFMANIAVLIGFLIIVYSMSYMGEDKSQTRYYALILLFIGAMAGLVLANNFLQLFIFWEVVGVCSYALIGFWYEKPEAARAGMKAFVVTRVGDVFLLIGIVFLFTQVGSFNYIVIQDAVELGLISLSALTMTSLFTFGGAMGKSAQVPFHVWLPDAMQGPTPVSALIHAATMVKAGIYLVGRTFFLFGSVTLWLNTVIIVGAITTILAATIALVSTDLKAVLAYSTISQLGLIMAALGVGTTLGWFAGQAHVMSHAIFKALLFLCAGSVLHAVMTNDINQMGGLRRKMPITFAASLIGVLALAGIFPFNGFWSKDLIFAATLQSGALISLILLWVASVFTVAYSFRWIILIFMGNPRNEEIGTHVHESPKLLTVPLMILAVGVVFSAFLIPTGLLATYFDAHIHFEIELIPLLLSLSTLVIGGIPAILIYKYRKPAPEFFSQNRITRALQTILSNGYYFDKIYDWIFVRGTLRIFNFILSRVELGTIDRFHYIFAPKVEAGSRILDQVVESRGSKGANYKFAQFMVKTSIASNYVDANIVDGAVNGIAKAGEKASRSLRRVQTGITMNYVLAFVVGIILLILFLVTLVG
ncbi:MAG: NADH-quinone oxidoreductase subunit L [Promethearchaeota archaeon]